MNIFDKFEFPKDKKKIYDRAKLLETFTIFYFLSVIILMYLVMGSSQAMKSAWIEDILALIPPIVFLISSKVISKHADNEHQYGYHRVTTIASLTGSVALFAMGLFLFYDGVVVLVKQEHPTIGTIKIFGENIWQGWAMISVLIYGAIPPVILGRMKIPLAKKLHDKVLHTDADMNKADWLTAGAAIIGILGIGFGFWWADAIAAIIISIDVFHDGFSNMKTAIMDLMDRIPKTVDRSETESSIFKAKEILNNLDWIEKSEIRLRENGHVFFGEVFFIPRTFDKNLPKKIRDAQDLLNQIDWKFYDIQFVIVDEIPDSITKKIFSQSMNSKK